jgi:hypothetical protein
MAATWEWTTALLSRQITGRAGNEFTGRVKGVQLAIAEDAVAVGPLVSPEDAVRIAMARQ